jgi:hypothetical protein
VVGAEYSLDSGLVDFFDEPAEWEGESTSEFT